jgi:hypothetical protein
MSALLNDLDPDELDSDAIRKTFFRRLMALRPPDKE